MASVRDLCSFHLYLNLTRIIRKEILHELYAFYIGRESASSWSLVISHRDKNTMDTSLRTQDCSVTCLTGHVKFNRAYWQSFCFLPRSLLALVELFACRRKHFILPAQINPTILHSIKRSSFRVIFHVLAAGIIYTLFSTFFHHS